MRIAFFSDFALGQTTGVSDALRSTIRTLEKRGHTAMLVSPLSGAKRDDDSKIQTIDVPSIGIPWAPTFRLTVPFGCPKSLRDFRPDIIHTQTFGPVGIRALHCAQKLGVPIVGTQHTLPREYAHYIAGGATWVGKKLNAYGAWYYERCDAIVAPSLMVRAELKDYGVTKRITIIPCPIETELFLPMTNKKIVQDTYGIRSPAIVFLGRIEKEKNIEELLIAFAIAHAKKPSLTLVIIGDGTQKEILQNRAQELGIGTNVRFMGQRQEREIAEILNACDIFVITSRSETQSLATLQAMACGLPVVATRSGALPEIVREGETGFLFAAGDTETCAQHLLTLIDDDSRRAEYGKNARSIAEQYAPTSITQRLEEFYATVLQEKVYH